MVSLDFKNDNYSNACLRQLLKRRPKIGLKTDYCFMQSKELQNAPSDLQVSILQYFRPAFGNHLS